MNTLRTASLGVLIASALALPPLAFAQQDVPSMTYQAQERQFREMDKNGDGVLTREEINSELVLHQQFDTYDTDGNGSIELDEFYDYVKAHEARR